MKKKIVILSIVFVMLICSIAFVGCKTSKDGKYDGTYYLSLRGYSDKSDYIILKGDTWSNSKKLSGIFKVEGEKIDFYLQVLGQTEFLYSGTISDGIIKLNELGDGFYYCLESKLSSGEENKVVVVTFDAFGGEFFDWSTKYTQEVASGNLLSMPSQPTRNGYEFVGWSKTKSDGALWDFQKDVVSEDITLYAVWKEEWQEELPTVDPINIILDVNGGDALSVTSVKIKDSSSYKLPVPSRSDYFFMGWYYENLQMTDAFGVGLQSVKGMDGAVLTARWSSTTCRVTLNNLNPFVGEVEGMGYYEYGTDASVSAKPIRGYDFIGWYDDDNKLVSLEKDYTFKVQGNCEFTAHWQMREDIKPFDFISTQTTCIISGIKDKTAKVIELPNYVTNVNRGAFAGCNQVEYFTTPFVGMSADNTQSGFLGVFFNETVTDNSQVPRTLKTVKINGETKISSYAFKQCFNLTAVELGDGVSEVYSYAFDYCTALKSVTIAAGVEKVNSNAFRGCNSIIVYCKAKSQPSGWHASWLNDGSTVIWNHKEVGKTQDGIEYSLSFDDKIYITKYADDGSMSCKLPDSINGFEVEGIVGNAMPNGYENIEIPAGIALIGNNVFANCYTLKSIVVDADNKNYFSQDGILYNADKTSLVFAPSKVQGEVVIPKGVTAIENNAFRYRTDLAGVRFEKDSELTDIKEEAFAYCNNLSSIEIPSSLKAVGVKAFLDCKLLKGVYISDLASWCNINFGKTYSSSFGTPSFEWRLAANPLSLAKNLYLDGVLVENLIIPEGITTIKEICFANCYSITELQFPKSLNSINNYAFYNCNLKNLEISANINLQSYSFQNCNNLKSINICSDILRLNNVFYGSEKIETAIVSASAVGDIPRNNLKYVKINGGSNIGTSALYGSEKLESVEISSEVKTIGENAFRNCGNLKNIIFQDGNSITSIGNMAFALCKSLTHFELTSNVVSVGENAFTACRAITIYCEASEKPSGWNSNWSNTSSTKKIPVVWDCKNNDVAENGNIYYVAENGLRYALKDGKATVEIQSPAMLEGEITIPDIITYKGSIYDITEIADSAFFECVNIEKIIMSDSITVLNYRAFADCANLKSVKLSNNITSIISNVFYNCSNLTSIVIPISVIELDNVFANCNRLTVIYCEVCQKPSEWSDNWNANKSVVWGYNNVTTNADYDYVINNDKIYLTRYKGSETDIILPQTIDGKEVVSFGEIFKGTDITSIQITGIKRIYSHAFENCTNLTSVAIIGNDLTYIGYEAFSGCENMNEFIIPASVTFVDGYAFNKCKEIKIFLEKGIDISKWSSSWKYGCNMDITGGYVPSET